MEGDAATLVFRAVQEGLNNIVRHAQAHKVDISFVALVKHVILKLRDDGRGCESAKVQSTGSEGQGSGIGGMRDRVLLFGGQLHIDSSPGQGFAISIEFPLATTAGQQ